MVAALFAPVVDAAGAAQVHSIKCACEEARPVRCRIPKAAARKKREGANCELAVEMPPWGGGGGGGGGGKGFKGSGLLSSSSKELVWKRTRERESGRVETSVCEKTREREGGSRAWWCGGLEDRGSELSVVTPQQTEQSLKKQSGWRESKKRWKRAGLGSSAKGNGRLVSDPRCPISLDV
ncbi:hypothetical protein N658DRAFT_156704 [Parathielavia hyrcaniae]|uniref:Uncharacterized protein n=1 Tax=Parathielavia hyrcaniae TaxID=113614 RepID=A0AAN6SZL2_9PEZI|nr:hypothetical protein N658DRAFT_156704 [Parathielavia hyrcaniae]